MLPVEVATRIAMSDVYVMSVRHHTSVPKQMSHGSEKRWKMV